MNTLGNILHLILPILLGGLFNMIFVKVSLCNGLRVPLDGARVMKDGKRLFGDNKTVKGFIGMIVWTAFWFEIFYWIAHFSPGRRCFTARCGALATCCSSCPAATSNAASTSPPAKAPAGRCGFCPSSWIRPIRCSAAC
jgi:CDP-diglyceride synthetase